MGRRQSAGFGKIGVGETAGVLYERGLGLTAAYLRQGLARRFLETRIAAIELFGNDRGCWSRRRADLAQSLYGNLAQILIGLGEGCRQGFDSGRRCRPQLSQRLGRQDALILAAVGQYLLQFGQSLGGPKSAECARRLATVPVAGCREHTAQLGDNRGVLNADLARRLDGIRARPFIVEVACDIGQRPRGGFTKITQHARGVAWIAAVAQGRDHGLDRRLRGAQPAEFAHCQTAHRRFAMPRFGDDFV